MRLRTAEPADAEALTALINSAFQVEKFFIDTDRIDPGQVRGLIEKGAFLVLEEGEADGGEPSQGQAMVSCVYVEERGSRAYFGLLSVAPARQGHGLGRKLIAAAEERCRARAARFMDLQIVNLREELPAYYERLGYVRTGTAPFPSEVATKLPCHFIKMSKAL